uniref:Putative polyprotein n=1 Tax=Phytophthora infestans TaxID=4787 RepID=Q572I3_PHYIN|nr:putative polyprotein [Phytophthora infestans]
MTTTKRAEVLLGSGNYFHWEYNMRMTLARKGLLAHIQAVKPENEITEAWLVNDAKALGIIAQGVELQHQTKIRSATRSIEAWGTLREFYNRTTAGSTMAKHLDAFDELIVGLQTLGEPMDEARQLVVLLSSLPDEYELISSIVENAKGVTLIEAKEKLLKEYERLEKKETMEKAFQVNGNAGKFRNGRGNGQKWNDRKWNGPKRNVGFKGKCFNCDQVSHMKRDCPAAKKSSQDDAVFAVGGERSAGWLIDSGATSHMTPHRNDLFGYEALDSGINVTIADGKKLRVAGTGTVKLTGLDGKRIRMVDVLHIPGLDRRLLSVGKLAERGMSVAFQRSSCVIWGRNAAIASGKKVGKAFLLDCQQEEAHFVQYAGPDSEWELWHARMGHLNKDALTKTQRSTIGIPHVKNGNETLCGGCMKGKQTVTTFPSRSLTRTTRVLELVHTDVMGPMRTISKGGAKYVLTFVDDYSRFVVAYFMKSKSEVGSKLKEFKALYETQWGERLKCLRSDNGTEFVNKTVLELCKRNGIVHQRSVPYSPQQNGVSERMNRTIMEKARSMLHYKSMSTQWWAEAVSTAVYLINRSTNTSNSDVTPYELSFQVKPRMEHLRVFGSQGYAHVNDVIRTKLEPKSFKCTFLGYAENVKGYRVYDMDASKVKVTRSVKLDEREVGGIYDTQSPASGTVIHVTRNDDTIVPISGVERTPAQDEPMEEAEEPAQDIEMDDLELERNAEIQQLPAPEEPRLNGLDLATFHSQPPSFHEDRMVFHPETERSTRPREPLLLLGNGDDEDVERGSDGPSSPKRTRIDEDGLLAEAVLAYAASIGGVPDTPNTYAEAIASNEAGEWRRAMQSELNSHSRNGTWTLVPRGTTTRSIGCRWVFTKKRDENGRVIRYKARLVAQGFKQKFGIDFFETYSPVANMNSIRAVLAVCVTCGYIMEQLDADTAFLNSCLVNLVYMDVPLGLENAEGMKCNLLKAIYGLKQAASAWNKTIHRVFLQNGFKCCGADQCVYVKRSKNAFVYVCLYVDDMIIAAKTRDEIREVKNALKSAFKMKELGEAKFILGMEIDHDRECGTLMIKQTRYIDDIVERFNQRNAKMVEYPCAANLKLSKMMSPTTEKERAEMWSRPYRSLIGCLMYITTCTRPDIAYVVTQLARFLEDPGTQHWKAAIRVLQYLKSTRHHGIVYKSGTSGFGTQAVKAEAFTDADWGSNIDDRRSVSGVMVMIGNAPVVFKSKYQRTVALSSAEAEYMALSLCTQEVLWTRAMLKDMGHEQVGATQVWEDNQGAIALASNAGYHARTKHVDIRHHFIRENVERSTIKVAYIDTKQQLADMLTKALGTKSLAFLREASGIKKRNDVQ